MKRSVGIVGGLGPETTAKFYLSLIKRFRDKCNSYPAIVIDNVPFPFYLEKDIIQKSMNEDKLLPFLKESIKRLNMSQADFIVIPCDTVHIFIDELKKESSVPIVNMVDETIRMVKENNYKKIGILTTTKAINDKLYEILLAENGIDVIIPVGTEQDIVAKIILRILNNTSDDEDKKTLLKIAKKLIEQGSECILLGCTDLQLILKQNKFEIPLIDSMNILEKSTFERLFTGKV